MGFERVYFSFRSYSAGGDEREHSRVGATVYEHVSGAQDLSDKQQIWVTSAITIKPEAKRCVQVSVDAGTPPVERRDDWTRVWTASY